MGLVSQEPSLFSASIAENIAYGAPNASPESIARAAKQVYLFICIRLYVYIDIHMILNIYCCNDPIKRVEK